MGCCIDCCMGCTDCEGYAVWGVDSEMMFIG